MITIRKTKHIDSLEYYKALIPLVIHSETISWTRFYNFLVSSTILIIAWATIFVGQSCSPYSWIVLSALSFFGCITGICFALLGSRSRQYLDLHFDQAMAIENGKKEVSSEISLNPFIEADKIRNGVKYVPQKKNNGQGSCFNYMMKFLMRFGTSRRIIVVGPLAYFILFLFLLYVSIKLSYS